MHRGQASNPADRYAPGNPDYFPPRPAAAGGGARGGLPAIYSTKFVSRRRKKLIQITIERYGLDHPPTVQYTRWLSNLLKGDWGYSPSWRQPVLEGLLCRLPATIELVLFAMVPAILLSLFLGSQAAYRRGKVPDLWWSHKTGHFFGCC